MFVVVEYLAYLLLAILATGLVFVASGVLWLLSEGTSFASRALTMGLRSLMAKAPRVLPIPHSLRPASSK